MLSAAIFVVSVKGSPTRPALFKYDRKYSAKQSLNKPLKR